jgi:hypothetical protein
VNVVFAVTVVAWAQTPPSSRPELRVEVVARCMTLNVSYNTIGAFKFFSERRSERRNFAAALGRWKKRPCEAAAWIQKPPEKATVMPGGTLKTPTIFVRITRD